MIALTVFVTRVGLVISETKALPCNKRKLSDSGDRSWSEFKQY